MLSRRESRSEIMEIGKAAVRGSPYVGIFSSLTDKLCLLPTAEQEEKAKFFSEFFGVEVFRTTLANSSLLGIFAAGNKKGFVVSGIVENYEVENMEKAGIKVMQVPGIAAIGNLIEANDKFGLCSRVFSMETKKKMEKFLGIKMEYAEIAGSDLIGACLVATNRGFLMNPNASKKEFGSVGKSFGMRGKAATLNYGDVFVGNSIIANSNAAIVGLQTSGHELIKIDEGLRGE